MQHDLNLTLDLIAEDLPAAERLATSLGLALQRGIGQYATDLYVPFFPTRSDAFLLRLRCDGYDDFAPSFQFVNPGNVEQLGEQWWPRMEAISYPRGEQNDVLYCTPGIREYHQHPSHRHEVHSKATWKLPRVIYLVWKYMHGSGAYLGRGGM